MSDILEANARLNVAAEHVRAYAGGDASLALVKLIDVLTEHYKEELTHVRPEGLLALQAQVAQLAALRAVALGAVQTNGRI